MQDKIKQISKIYSLTKEQFEKYYKTALLALTTYAKPSKNKTLVIVGGQSGAGKSRLIPVAKRDLANNAVIVDFDELRALHPYYKEVSNNYPEITHKILHEDTERVKNKILEKLIKDEYNVIYEGALRNTQGFIDFAQDFKKNNYNIEMDIMAVPKLESYGSTFYRFANQLITNQTPRWVEKFAHDGSYEGVIKTVQAFREQGLVDNIKVYVRNETEPRKIYSSKERQHENAIVAINYGRDIGRKRAIHNFSTKYNIVEAIFKHERPEMLDTLKDWQQLYEEEKNFFMQLNNTNAIKH